MTFGPIYPSSRHDRPHARVYDHHVIHPSFKNLNGKAFQLLVTLWANFRPNEPNAFPVGGMSVAKMVSVSPKTAAKLVDELISAGHLREERKGRNRGQVKTRERVVSLTRFDTDTSAGDPERPLEVWRRNRKPETLSE